MPLPQEDAVKQDIQVGLHDELLLADRLLDFATGIFTSGNAITKTTGIDDHVVMVALGLAAKMCKQYRAVVALAELGLREDADALLRMHFEAMMAMQFLLRRKVSLREGGKKVPAVPGKPLTTRFRTQLYIANDMFNGKKFLDGLLRTPGLKRDVSKEFKTAIEADAKNWEGVIGLDWTKRLKKARSYSGLSIIDLADSLGYGRIYQSLYRTASSAVHANDAARFVDTDGDGSLVFKAAPSGEGLGFTLRFASLFLIRGVEAVDDRFGFGMAAKIEEFHEAIGKMKLDFHPEDEGG